MSSLEKSAICSGVAALGLLGLAESARAQDPAGLANQAPATTGKTEVAQEGFQAVAAAPEENNDATTLKLTAGGFLSRGNTRTVSVTAAGDFFVRRAASQFNLALAANYGRSAAEADAPSRVTIQNYQARARYDHFVSERLAAFLSVSARNDRFQGLNLRLNIDPGVGYYFIDDKGHRLWAELGYDLQLDLRRQEFIDAAAADPAVADLSESEIRNNVRAFVGYDNQLSEAVTFAAGLEYLQDVEATENARLNVDAGVTSQLKNDFSVAMTLSVRYDNAPLPGVEKTDVITALNLVYTMTE